MAAKAKYRPAPSPPPKTKSRPAPTFPDLEPIAELLRTKPTTMADRLAHIRALGLRLLSHIRFMCAVQKLAGSSLCAKEDAVTAFYERLVLVEQELGRIKGTVHGSR
jgi:hypothetical protein